MKNIEKIEGLEILQVGEFGELEELLPIAEKIAEISKKIGCNSVTISSSWDGEVSIIKDMKEDEFNVLHALKEDDTLFIYRNFFKNHECIRKEGANV